MFKAEVQCGSSLQSSAADEREIGFQILTAYIIIKTDASAITIPPFPV